MAWTKRFFCMILLFLTAVYAVSCAPATEGLKQDDIPIPPVYAEGNLFELLKHPVAPEQPYAAPLTWDYTETRDNQELRIAATLDVPSVSKYPAVSLLPSPLDIGYVEKALAFFAPGEQLYYSTVIDTKSYYADALSECRNLIVAHTPEKEALYGPINASADSELQKSYDSALEAPGLAPIPKVFWRKDASDDRNSSCLYQTADGSVRLSAYTSDNGMSNHLSFVKTLESGGLNPTGVAYDKAENPAFFSFAVNEANNYLKVMGLEEYHLAHAEKTIRRSLAHRTVYQQFLSMPQYAENATDGVTLVFVPSYGGIPGAISRMDTINRDDAVVLYNSATSLDVGSSNQECISIWVGEDGIESVQWENAKWALGETLNDNLPLVPFEEIKQGFIDQLFRQMNTDRPFQQIGTAPGEVSRLQIDKITLSYRRIYNPDRPEEYLLIPAWDFYGNMSLSFPEDGTEDAGVRSARAQQLEAADDFLTSFMTISAIDGTVIDNLFGY